MMQLNKIFLIIFFFLSVNSKIHGQVIYDDRLTEIYAMKVKLLDEFMERFNDDKGSYIRSYAASNKIDFTLTRESLLKSLFDHETHKWDSLKILDFIRAMVTPLPKHLYFTDNDWYALLDCIFDQHGKKIPVKLSLQLQHNKDGSMKWVICGVKSTYTGAELSAEKKSSIGPSDYGVDFMGLHRAMNDKNNLANYFPQSMEYDPLSVFTFALKKGDLKFREIKDISYHFLQINGWIFSIRNFTRQTTNSGWLINRLIKTGKNESWQKEEYKRNNLGIFN